MLVHVGPHTVLALFTLSVGLISYFTGVLGGFLGRFHIGYKPWAHHAEIHTRIWAAHAWIARINVIGGYLACSIGIIGY